MWIRVRGIRIIAKSTQKTLQYIVKSTREKPSKGENGKPKGDRAQSNGPAQP